MHGAKQWDEQHGSPPAVNFHLSQSTCRCRKIESGWRGAQNQATLGRMLDLIKLIFCLVFDLFRSRATLEAEILVLRQQIIVLRRGRVGRLPFSASDRLVLG